MENQITAEAKKFKSGVNGFVVFIQGSDVENKRTMNFADPLKAMRYCFILKRQTSMQIVQTALDFLSAENRARKASVPAEEKETITSTENIELLDFA